MVLPSYVERFSLSCVQNFVPQYLENLVTVGKILGQLVISPSGREPSQVIVHLDATRAAVIPMEMVERAAEGRYSRLRPSLGMVMMMMMMMLMTMMRGGPRAGRAACDRVWGGGLLAST